jgi:TonB family protein
MKAVLLSFLCLLFITPSSFAQEQASQSQPAKNSVVLPVTLKAYPTKFPKGAPLGHYVVSVAFVVDEHGIPRHPQVVQSENEYFDFAAMVTALQWRFKPGLRDGKPVATPLTVQLSFDKEPRLGGGE